MSVGDINFNLGNESMIKVLPEAAVRLLGLIEKQGEADHGALLVAVAGGR